MLLWFSHRETSLGTKFWPFRGFNFAVVRAQVRIISWVQILGSWVLTKCTHVQACLASAIWQRWWHIAQFQMACWLGTLNARARRTERFDDSARLRWVKIEPFQHL